MSALSITVGADTPAYLLLRLTGTLDGRSASELTAHCSAAASTARRLILNLAGVDMITSSGIGVLLALVEEHGQQFNNVRVAEPSPAVSAVIRVLNLNQFLTLDDSEEQSIRAAEAA